MTRVPVLDLRSDAENCDYEQGSYSCNIASLGHREAFSAEHRLDQCPPLTELLISGQARFCVEVCSKSSFDNQIYIADAGESNQQVTLDASMFALDAPQVLPGIIAMSRCSLHTDGCSDPWRMLGDVITVEQGQHLAHGQHINLKSPRHSIVSLVADDSVDKGHMKRRYIHDGQPRYEVSLHPDDLALCKSQEHSPASFAVLLASWVAVLSDAALQNAFAGDESGTREPLGEQLAQMIRAKDPDCPVPGDEEYDPLQVATLLHGNELIRFDDRDNEQ